MIIDKNDPEFRAKWARAHHATEEAWEDIKKCEPQLAELVADKRAYDRDPLKYALAVVVLGELAMREAEELTQPPAGAHDANSEQDA